MNGPIIAAQISRFFSSSYDHHNYMMYLLEWPTSFFMASLEIACPHNNLTGGLVSKNQVDILDD